MRIGGKPYRTIWRHGDGVSIEIIDQTRLPHALETVTLRTLEDAAHAQVPGTVADRPWIEPSPIVGDPQHQVRLVP